MATLQDYLNEIKKTSRFNLVKIELLRSDETPLREIVTELRLDGTLNIKNRNGVRRNVNLTLDNTLKEFFPSLDSGIWVAQKFKLYLGLLINGEEFFLPQGIFVYEDPDVGTDGSVRISASDKFSLLDNGKLEFDTILTVGTTIGDAYRLLLSLTTDPKPPIVDSSLEGLTLPYDIIKESGDPIADFFTEIAFAFSANTFYNNDGFLVIEPDTKDSEKGSIQSFDGDSRTEVNYIDGNVKYDFDKVKNRIKVIGDNVNGTIVEATVSNNDLLSPTSIPNLDGEVLLDVIKDDIISTVAYAEQRAIYELKRKTNVSTEIRVNSIILPHLEVDKVVDINDSRIDFVKKRMLLDSITMPLNNSSNMSFIGLETFDIDA